MGVWELKLKFCTPIGLLSANIVSFVGILCLPIFWLGFSFNSWSAVHTLSFYSFAIY